jgi:predicted nucleotidyltransferase
MNSEIIKSLKDVEERHGCKILFAVESGSRAWGFASSDSDYDIRGVYVKPLDWYLQLRSGVPDTITESLKDDFDISLWDIRKAFFQMAKSNASFMEWLDSPIVYKDCGLLARLNEIKNECVNPIHIVYHYASMFRHAMGAKGEDGTISLKKLCYALRANLCLRYVMEEEKMPPTKFDDVFNKVNLSREERDAISAILAKKEISLEGDLINIENALEDLLEDRYESLSAYKWSRNGSERKIETTLESLFQYYVKDVSSFCSEVGAAVYAGEYDASLIGREFVHFKGGRYRLLGFARSSESEELMAVYQTLYGESGMWVRPAKMFFENITRDGVTQPRFRPI